MGGNNFTLDMTITEALSTHPRAIEILAGFGISGCAMCHAAQFETLDELCTNYGLDSDKLLGALEGLVGGEPAPRE